MNDILNHSLLGKLQYQDILGWVGKYEKNAISFEIHLDVDDTDIDAAARVIESVTSDLQSVEHSISTKLYPVYSRDCNTPLAKDDFISTLTLSVISVNFDVDPNNANINFLYSSSLFSGHSIQVSISPNGNRDISLVG